MLTILSQAAEQLSASARDVGRGDGTAKARSFFENLGREMEDDGADDGPVICDSMMRYFAKVHSALTVNLLRKHATFDSLRAAMKASGVEPERWDGLATMLADYLLVDYVTPAPSAALVRPEVEEENGVSGRGGSRLPRFSDDGETLGARLDREGKLYDQHFTRDDFADLNLPLVLQPKHKAPVTDRVFELTLERYETPHVDDQYESEAGGQLQALFGDMPQEERDVKRAMALVATGLISPRSAKAKWSGALKWEFRNRRKSKSTVRRAPHTCSHAAILTSPPPFAVQEEAQAELHACLHQGEGADGQRAEYGDRARRLDQASRTPPTHGPVQSVRS